MAKEADISALYLSGAILIKQRLWRYLISSPEGLKYVQHVKILHGFSIALILMLHSVIDYSPKNIAIFMFWFDIIKKNSNALVWSRVVVCNKTFAAKGNINDGS